MIITNINFLYTFRLKIQKMFREAENSSDDEIEVLEEVEAEVMVVEVVKKASGWHWNSLTCSKCSGRCDELAFQGISLHISSCGHFYCEACSSAVKQPHNHGYQTCVDTACHSIILSLTKINFS